MRAPRYRFALGADHAGYGLKEALKRHLLSAGHEVHDVGTFSTASVDFPPIAARVARLVKTKAADFGVLVDGAGSPSAMVANRFPGVRCAVLTNAWTAEIARQHSDANCAAFGARVVGVVEAREILDVFLSTKFLGEAKYQKRLDQVREIERYVAGERATLPGERGR